MSTDNWKVLQYPSADELEVARHQFHQAIQNVGSIGRSFLSEDPSDVTANLEWDSKLQRLAGRWIEGDEVFRSSFSLSDFSVLLVDELYNTISSISLQAKKQTDVMIWLEEQIAELGLKSSDISLKLPYTIPEYPTAKREAFNEVNPMAAQELEAWFHNTDLVLKRITAEIDGASEVRCWPHHFDIASLITLVDTGDAETSKSINIGMSPGDGNYNEPYFYVSPWPYPVSELPDISPTGGFWHEENWIGAILRASDMSHLKTAKDQQDAVVDFLDKNIKTLKGLLGE
jgi:hypothetical protein